MKSILFFAYLQPNIGDENQICKDLTVELATLKTLYCNNIIHTLNAMWYYRYETIVLCIMLFSFYLK